MGISNAQIVVVPAFVPPAIQTRIREILYNVPLVIQRISSLLLREMIDLYFFMTSRYSCSVWFKIGLYKISKDFDIHIIKSHILFFIILPL